MRALLLLLALSLPARALTYAEWVAQFPSIADAAATADPDGDGITNLLEYALADLDPTAPDGPGKLPEMVFGTRAADTELPSVDPGVVALHPGPRPPESGSWHLGLRYAPRAGVEGIRFLPQYSWHTSNLGAWLDGRAAFSPPTAPDAQGRVIQWMLGQFEAAKAPPRAFARLRVQETGEAAP